MVGGMQQTTPFLFGQGWNDNSLVVNGRSQELEAKS